MSGTTLRQLSRAALGARCAAGLSLQAGPFVLRIQGADPVLADCLHAYYPNYPLAAEGSFADAQLTLKPQAWVDRWRDRPRQICLEDGLAFTDFPLEALLANLEWSFNWCVATHANQYVMLHAAGVAKQGHAVLMPGVPGAGKSTLSAYLIHRGWRLLSDEFTLVRNQALDLHAFPRLIPLKNDAIDVIQNAVPQAQFGPRIPGTRKGTVAHLRPGDEHIQAMHEPARPRLVVFPTYERGSATTLTAVPAAECFTDLTQNCFNYALLGRQAFQMLGALTNHVEAFRMRYSELASAEDTLSTLLARVIEK